MKKLISLFTIVLATLFIIGSASAMTLAWDAYTDTKATDLRIYSSLDQSTWAILLDSIPTGSVAAEIPDNPVDNQRVHYLMRAFDSVSSQESGDSNSISFYWTTGGAGFEGPAGVDSIKFLDCDPFDGIADDGTAEWGLCNGRFNKP